MHNNIRKLPHIFGKIPICHYHGIQRVDISDTESIQLYGAKHRKFITNHWYWGEAGYGALFGKRSGYLEGGIFTGIMSNGPFDGIIDYRIFTGAGGGGSAPQGGDLLCIQQ